MMQCPRCRGNMHTYDRSGVQIDQCQNCRGIFLDYGELEHLSQLEANMSRSAHHGYAGSAHPPGFGAMGWGSHHGHRRKKGWAHMLFTS